MNSHTSAAADRPANPARAVGWPVPAGSVAGLADAMLADVEGEPSGEHPINTGR